MKVVKVVLSILVPGLLTKRVGGLLTHPKQSRFGPSVGVGAAQT